MESPAQWDTRLNKRTLEQCVSSWLADGLHEQNLISDIPYTHFLGGDLLGMMGGEHKTLLILQQTRASGQHKSVINYNMTSANQYLFDP